MEKMFNCSESMITDLVHNDTWYKILKDRNHVRIPGDNPIKISNYIKDQPENEWEILDRDGINIHDNERYVNDALYSPTQRTVHPFDVFFYDNSKELATQKEDFGALTLTKCEGNSNYLTRSWEQLITLRQSCSWNYILRRFHNGMTPPSSSLVIIDRYLFGTNKAAGTDYKNGIRNVYGILNELLPKSFSGEYHILLVFDSTTLVNNRKDKIGIAEKIKCIAKGLQKIKTQMNRNYVPTIELLTINNTHNNDYYSESHNRKIISNYFMISCGRGFSALRPPECNKDSIEYIGESEAIWKDRIYYDGIYNGIDADPIDYDSDSLPTRECDYDLDWLRKYIKTLRDNMDENAYICNGNLRSSITDFRNRLITCK